jgi:hypothetical protein
VRREHKILVSLDGRELALDKRHSEEKVLGPTVANGDIASAVRVNPRARREQRTVAVDGMSVEIQGDVVSVDREPGGRS